MELPIYQVDAFTSTLFRGNPAAVVILQDWPQRGWPDDVLLQSIAAENNLSETAFVVPGPTPDRFGLRWFTPELEIDLCGHATLATAHVLFSEGIASGAIVRFDSKSGELRVERAGDLLALDFPSRPPHPIPHDPRIAAALGKTPREVLAARDLLVVYDRESDVREMRPDFAALAAHEAFGFIVTAEGDRSDFVSRFFVPRAGINEDPVTGSAHCTLVPYWSRRLGKNRLHALQISERGGELFCEDHGERIRIAGRAVRYMSGRILLQSSSISFQPKED
jgi:PhzF family phenazine biosynthesis protein